MAQFASDLAYNLDFKGMSRPTSDTSYGAYEAGATVQPPAAPASLTATAGNGQVGLSWAASAGATSYNLYRSTSTGAETLLRSGLTGTSTTDTGLTNGTTYFYKLTAVNSAGEGGKSSEASARPQATGVVGTGTGLTGQYFADQTLTNQVLSRTIRR